MPKIKKDAIPGGKIQWCSCSEKQSGGSLEKLNKTKQKKIKQSFCMTQ